MFVAATTRASNVIGRVSPTRSNLALLQRAQEPGLQRQAHERHFVDEERAAMRQFAAAHSADIAPVNAPSALAEQLRLGERLGNRRRVERDEPLLRARAVVVNRAGDELLARARLALNQHGAVHRRDELQALEDGLHRGALADDVAEAIPIAQLRTQLGVLLPQSWLVHGRREHARQMRGLHRLDEEVDRASLDCRQRLFDAADAGHHDRRHRGISGERGIEDVEAVGVRQLQIDDETVVGETLEALECARAGRRLRHGEAFLRQMFSDELSQPVVILDDEDARLGS